jgi:hypothetical protein
MNAESPSPDNSLTRKSFLRISGLGVGALAAGGATSAFGVTAKAAPQQPATQAAALVAAAGPSTGGPILASGKFPIGLFWPPPPLETTVERYQEIAEAGFTFAHGGNYTWADPQISTQMLKVAEEAGIHVLVDDVDIRWVTRNFSLGDPAAPFTMSESELRQKVAAAVNRYAPAWQVIGGRLHISYGSGNGSIGSVSAGTAWRDYVMAFDTEPLRTGAGGYAQAGWAFRLQDEGNAYVWLLSTQGSDGKAVLKKAVFTRGAPVVTSTPLPYQLQDGVSYHVETSVVGSTITTKIDGVLVDTTTDATFATGTVGFREAGPESAYFDNLRVTTPDGSLLFSEDFSGSLAAWTRPAGSGYTSFAGMHVYDEPAANRLPFLAQVVTMANEAYPDALSYVNQLPGFGAGYEQAASQLDTPVLSFDRYPILSSGEDLGYFKNWADVRAAALAHGRHAWTFIQSVGYNGHAIPTKADLLWQITISLAYGCKGIQYFTYWTPDPARGEGFTIGLITVQGKRTSLYQEAKMVNNQYLAPLGKQMLGLTSTAVQVAGLANPPAGLEPFAPDELVSAVSGAAVVLGRFVDGEERRHALVANYSRTQDVVVNVTLGATTEAFDPRNDTWVPQRSGSLELAAGTGRLLRTA